MYAALTAVWLVLGAILNPTAFLPYATGSMTFIAVLSAKAAAFKAQAEQGFD